MTRQTIRWFEELVRIIGIDSGTPYVYSGSLANCVRLTDVPTAAADEHQVISLRFGALPRESVAFKTARQPSSYWTRVRLLVCHRMTT